MSVDPSKAALREQIASRRSRMSEDERRAAGEAIAAHLRGASELAKRARVALFAGLPDEPDTRPVFEGLSEAGHTLLLPRSGRSGRLRFVAVDAWEDLRPGRYGVLEPAPDRAPVAPSEISLALVPGVAFDRAGRRLGRGGGYYDRTFPSGEGGPVLIGVAFALQLVECVPTEPHDRAVDGVVTEAGLLWMRGGPGGD